MKQRVDITEIGALNRMRANLDQYRAEVESALTAVATRVQRTLGVLGERIRYWERQYHAWRAEADKRLSLFNQCQERPSREQQRRGCDREFELWREAELKAATALANKKQNESLYRMVERAEEESRPARDQLRTMLSGDLQRATTTLSQTAARARLVHAGTAAPLAGAAGTMFQVAPAVGVAADSDAAPGEDGDIAAPAPGEGETREGPPNVEGAEGGVRIDLDDGRTNGPIPRESDFERSPEGRW